MTQNSPHEAGALRRARTELRRVVATACADLLEEAALLRAGWSPFGACVPEFAADPGRLSAWRASARHRLEDARLAIEAAPAVLRRLRALVATHVAAWPGAATLAREAARLDPRDRRRLALAQTLLADGEARRARRVLAGLIAREPERHTLWRAWVGLGATHESEGNDRLAGAALERAVEIRGAGAEPFIGSVFLALAVGDQDRARAACARLDRRATSDPRSMRDLHPSLRRLERRRAFLRPPSVPPASARVAREFTFDPSRPSALVARVFLGGAV